MSYSHEIVNKKDGTYDIELCKRRYFLNNKLGKVLTDIPTEEDAKQVSKLLDMAFNSGYKLGKGERNG